MKKNILLLLVVSGLFLSCKISAFVQFDYDKALLLSNKLKNYETPTENEKDLSNTDLSGADLSGADLSGAILSYANLTGAILMKVVNGQTLETSLSDAQLLSTDFQGAVMSEFQKFYARSNRAINVPN